MREDIIAVGVDIGGTNIKTVSLSEDMKIIASGSVPTPS